MTENELNALVRLEYNLDKLTELVKRQSELLERQQGELIRLKREEERLTLELEELREQGRLGAMARSLQAEEHQRMEVLGYLDEIIEEVRLCIKQLEQE